ncbi:hypothetical protein MPTK1_8g01080 [Marchantia polymorpha subsp. ruderalis]|uniref:TPM domain-containing protein n=1 Tax=Marchantia polymorpha TaxID=3197 RepID=A0A2R6WRD1_MARPO|nr:hypothetical protein MARPO_0064s0090 [Marchantia polymorpha]BBN18260.1 hypothetical protein Mp_8g01080 [Marchantia polymorpha subsp. ruderalis]|eukprot:PTQ36412.1 hypothetical protein MARPO_0064s0090 [Marchantia polymorpha]
MATLLSSALCTSGSISRLATRDSTCSSLGKSGISVVGGRSKKADAKLVVASALKNQNSHEEPVPSTEKGVATFLLNTAVASALSLSISLFGGDIALARPEGVNRPELLPKEFTPVIDVAGFLSPAQEGRIAQQVTSLEDETGYKLRVLAQNYPETPGLAVKNFWQVDDNTIVFVADPSMGNILNFNVGASVDLNVPRSFWSRLAGKYGNIFFWREQGEDASIEAAVEAIGECLREPAGPRACSEIK